MCAPVRKAAWNQGMEARFAPLVITPSDPLDILCFPSPQLCQAGSPVPIVDTFLPRDTARIPLNYWLQLLPGHLGHFVSEEQQESKGFATMGGTNDCSAGVAVDAFTK